MTVLYPRTGKTVLSSKLSKGVWELFRLLSRVPFKKSKSVLAYCGPTLLVVIVVFWVTCFLLGFALLIWPALGYGIQASEGDTPRDFATAVYYSGFTLTTLGVGDLVAKNAFWRLVTVAESAVGFSTITVALAYILSVYSALIRRNAFASSLFHRSAGEASAVALLIRLKGAGKFESALSEISTLTRDVLFLLESYHAYPVLHYFRFRDPRYSLARMGLIILDLATLIATALDPEEYKTFISSATISELDSGGHELLTALADSFLVERQLDQPESPLEWRSWYYSSIKALRQNGIKTIADVESGADRYVEARRGWDYLVRAFAQYMDYEWRQVAPAEYGVPLAEKRF